ncbi:hypothetical protein BCJMU51_p411 (plasmid) [Bacillus cereus]|uniref:hypothetical protein n=1 Tax=Bacillus cereus TaxID=1396 RepID=UPI001F3EB20C|nr:hypothetical protein [Bacillus cereus]BCC03733.1 hypothetical protein BCM0057_p211 [Bacillus cereus]BCC27253.1 hypothetical protein BCM0079_p209 [Bacillus cereus]BCC38800.1 hypothetical protein BCM0105_p209 [Bacillus cereus]BCC38817.1 hypothetical protein BCM0105_p311 [Bacillus cereus]BCC74283.1 hypothetical protein BCJMU51_p411 [Bacillus cereus]
MANTVAKDKFEIVEKFVNACMLKGVSEDKSFKLVEELCTLIQQKRHDEWFGLVDEALKEAGHEEGVTL